MFSIRSRTVVSLHQQNCKSFIDSLHKSLGKNCSHNSNDDEHPSQKPGQKESEDEHIQPDLSVITDNKADSLPSLKTVSVIPGKGPPPEPPITCCMTGCANCVWIDYAEELKSYYGDGGLRAQKALDHIEDPSLKAFIKLELGLK